MQINPAHTVPVLVDDDLIITESRAIMSYLVDKLSPDHGLHPRDIKIRAKVDQFLYFDQGTLTPSSRKIYLPMVYQGSSGPL